VAARGIPHRDHQRAVVVLAVLDGAVLAAAGRKAGCCENTAAVWCRRFQVHGLAGLVDRPKPSAPVVWTQLIASGCCTSPHAARSEAGRYGRLSLELLRRRLRREVGLEHIDPTTARRFFVLTGLSWQADRSCCTNTDAQLVEIARAPRPPMPG
jgi:hypothetical protein